MGEYHGPTDKDFQEFKALYVAEFGEGTPDDKLRQRMLELLELYHLLYATASGREIKITLRKTDMVVFAFIVVLIKDFDHPPTIRDISRFLGKKSSRSGQLVVDRLIDPGLLDRDSDDRLCLGESATSFAVERERQKQARAVGANV